MESPSTSPNTPVLSISSDRLAALTSPIRPDCARSLPTFSRGNWAPPPPPPPYPRLQDLRRSLCQPPGLRRPIPPLFVGSFNPPATSTHQVRDERAPPFPPLPFLPVEADHSDLIRVQVHTHPPTFNSSAGNYCSTFPVPRNLLSSASAPQPPGAPTTFAARVPCTSQPLQEASMTPMAS